MNLKQKVLLLGLSFTALFTPFVYADTPTNIVSFSTEIEKDVKYDLLQVSLFSYAENDELESATGHVNSKINKALEIIRNIKSIEIQENSRTTGVHYTSKGKQDGWIARGKLVLVSQNHEELSKVLTKLNGILAIESVQPSVSSSTLLSVENEMIIDVLEQFKNKANLIQSSLNGKNYRIVDINIITPVSRPSIRPYAARMYNKKSSFMSDEAVDIDVSESKTTLKATVDARIEIIME